MGFAAGLTVAWFIFGLLVGSFLNAVIYRLHTGRSLLEKHSICPHCKHSLAWPDLIPLVSFILLGGRCRYCQKSISWQYPLVELATAFAFVLVYLNFGLSPAAYYSLLVTCFLIVIFVYDLKHYLILDVVLVPAIILTAVYQLWQGNFLPAVIGAAALAGFFYLLYLFSHGRWIGFGDVKLGVFLGLLSSWPEVLALFFLAYLSGAAVGLGLLASGKRALGGRLPFGTFLSASGFVVMLWGEEMTRWYFNLIGIS